MTNARIRAFTARERYGLRTPGRGTRTTGPGSTPRLAHAGQLFLLTRTMGWESDLVTLGQLGDGTLDPVLIDGLNWGC